MDDSTAYAAALYTDAMTARAGIATWTRAGWAVVAVHHRPELGERPWVLWLRPVHLDGWRTPTSTGTQVMPAG